MDVARPFYRRCRGEWFLTRSFMMMCITKWLSATMAIALMASTAAATDTVAAATSSRSMPKTRHLS